MLVLDGVWGVVLPTVVLVLPLDRVSLWTIICFFSAIDTREEAF